MADLVHIPLLEASLRCKEGQTMAWLNKNVFMPKACEDGTAATSRVVAIVAVISRHVQEALRGRQDNFDGLLASVVGLLDRELLTGNHWPQEVTTATMNRPGVSPAYFCGSL